jgi:hypothetical protein
MKRLPVEVPTSLLACYEVEPPGPFGIANRRRCLLDLALRGIHRFAKTTSGPNRCFVTAYDQRDDVEHIAVDMPVPESDWQNWMEREFTNDEIEALRAAVAAKICPPAHDIVIDVDQGLVQDVHAIPEGIRVVVRDFDIEGADDDRIITDDAGRYTRSVYWRCCPCCNGEHPPCTQCGGVTRCYYEEPYEPFTVCDTCDRELQNVADTKGGT